MFMSLPIHLVVLVGFAIVALIALVPAFKS